MIIFTVWKWTCLKVSFVKVVQVPLQENGKLDTNHWGKIYETMNKNSMKANTLKLQFVLTSYSTPKSSTGN